MKGLLALLAASVLILIGCGSSATIPAATTDSWQSMEGPRAQDITTLLVSGESAPVFLAGSSNGIVYGTTDPGGGWKEISAIPKGSAVHRFVRHPEKLATLYAATDAGLFTSTDGGASWADTPLLTGSTAAVGVHSLAVDPWNTSVLYAGTSRRGICRSGDGGVTWSPANDGIPGLENSAVLEILIDLSRPDRVLAAASPFGVVQSTDGGKSWSRLTEEFTATSSSVTHLIQYPHAPATIVYGTDAGAIRKSTDGGATWSPTRNGFAEGEILSLSRIPGRPAGLLAGTETGVMVSDDFGSSWTDITGSLPHIPLATIPSPDGRTFFAFGEGIGLQQTKDSGASWTPIDRNLGGATIRHLATDGKGAHLYAALEHAVLAYDSTTGSWRSASSGLPGGTINSLVVDSDSPLHLYVATSLGGFESANGGQSWRPVSRNMRITPGILEPHPRIHTRMLASGMLGLDVSTDRGTTWRQTKPFESKYRISAFTYAPKNTGVIYGAASDAVVTSRDGGFLWESSRYGLHGEDITAITLDDRDSRTVYAWTSSGTGYRSLDGGLEWNKYTPPWQSHDAALIAFDRFDPSSVVALVNGKQIYYSPSGGGTWFPLPSATLEARPQSLWWNAPSGILYLGTKGNGVYRISILNAVRELAGDRKVAEGE